jgi:protein KRI1
MMAAQFDDDYYAAEDDEKFQKDEFDDDDDFNRQYLNDMEEEDDGDVNNDEEYGEDAGGYNEQEYDNTEEDHIGDGQKSSLLDELYQLDYEDIIDGMPCRFKYRQVKSENFGLDIEDLLNANDTELNQYVSLKKLAPYRDDKRNKDGEERAQKLSKKRKKLRVAVKERMEAEAAAAAAAGKQLKGTAPNVSTKESVEAVGENEGKRKRKRRKGSDGVLNSSKDAVDFSSFENKEDVVDGEKVESQKKKHKKDKPSGANKSQKSARLNLLK